METIIKIVDRIFIVSFSAGILLLSAIFARSFFVREALWKQDFYSYVQYFFLIGVIPLIIIYILYKTGLYILVRTPINESKKSDIPSLEFYLFLATVVLNLAFVIYLRIAF